MKVFIWLITMIPIGILFLSLGIYSVFRKKPMWFYSGTEVDEKDITDVVAYNRANGIMWMAFSAVYFISAILGIFQLNAAAYVSSIGSLAGIPILVFTYKKIYSKYKRNDK